MANTSQSVCYWSRSQKIMPAGGEWLINHTLSSFQQFWGILARGTHDPSRCLHAVCLWLERSFVLAALLPGIIECSIAHIVRSLRQLPVH